MEINNFCQICEKRKSEGLNEGMTGDVERRSRRGRRTQRGRRRKGSEGRVLGGLETIEESRGPIIIRSLEDGIDDEQMTPEAAVEKMVEEERRKGWALLQRGERAAAARSVPVELAVSWFR